MDEKLTVKEVVAFAFGFIGVILLCCEAETFRDQIVAFLGAAYHLGLAVLIWKLSWKGGDKDVR